MRKHGSLGVNHQLLHAHCIRSAVFPILEQACLRLKRVTS